MNICPACKKDIPLNLNFCIRCGAALGDTAPPAPSTPQLPVKKVPFSSLQDKIFKMPPSPAEYIKSNPQSSKNTGMIMWFLMTSAISVYGFACYIVITNNDETRQFPQLFFIVLSIISVVEFIIGFLLSKYGLHEEQLEKASSQFVLFSYIHTISIISMAFAEAIAVYGTIFVIISLRILYFFPFAVASLAGLFLHLGHVLHAYKFAEHFKGPDDIKHASSGTDNNS